MSATQQLRLPIPPISFQGRDIRSVTFKGGFDYPIHRWFRLTPSFSPDLVRDILGHWGLGPDARVLEPFCGVGTTPVVCQEHGLRSWAVELNPLLHFVARVKTTPLHDPIRLAALTSELVAHAQSIFRAIEGLPLETFLTRYRETIPRIRDVTKWWSPVVLKKLTAIRIALADVGPPPELADVFGLAVASILIEVSNALHNHPSLSFSKAARRDAPVFERVTEQVEMFVRDLQGFALARPETVILRGNSKRLGQLLPAGSGFDAVITSPPYPNRYSYARETRPQMFYLGLVSSGKEVGELEIEAIGGTWGKATSVLSAPVSYGSPQVEQALRGIPDQIGQHSHLMRNYIIKFFNDMEQHIESLRPFLRPRARLAYVIGNSQFYNIPLPSDEILADLFEANGIQTVSIERMRRRNSKSGLYEAVIFLQAPA